MSATVLSVVLAAVFAVAAALSWLGRRRVVGALLTLTAIVWALVAVYRYRPGAM